MLISFKVENWRSFRDTASISMIATSERQHGDRIPEVKKYRARLLPTAVIYGGNASGKTNFIQAMRFVKKMVLEGTGSQPDRLIDVEPFCIDSRMLNEPCRFTIEILVDEIIYELSFAVTRKAVIEEKLIKITSSTEKVLYNRKDEQPNFDLSIAKDEALAYAFKGTRNNQLFLTNSISQNNEAFLPVRNWFKNYLVLVAPDTRFEHYNYFIDEDNPLYTDMCKILPLLDTGIISLGGKELPFEHMQLPKEIKSRIQEELEEDKTVLIASPSEHLWFTISNKDGKLTAQKLVTKHLNSLGKETEFEMRNESDGSRRVIDLLPAILDVSANKSKKVYLVDELDRSLHTLLSKKLLQSYLESCSSESRAQMIITTHDLMLMDQEIFRRDEMWVMERNDDGNTGLFSFSEYKDLRNDKDIRKSYLQGRLGGIPKILLKSADTECLEIN